MGWVGLSWIGGRRCIQHYRNTTEVPSWLMMNTRTRSEQLYFFSVSYQDFLWVKSLNISYTTRF